MTFKIVRQSNQQWLFSPKLVKRDKRSISIIEGHKNPAPGVMILTIGYARPFVAHHYYSIRSMLSMQ